MSDQRVDLKGMLPDELRSFISSLGKEDYRTKQLLSWIYGKGVNSFDQMTNLSKRFREELSEIAKVSFIEEIKRDTSSDGAVTKFLFQLEDGLKVESVLIVEKGRRTACLSSQVGCPLGCSFCWTGRMGFLRNLTAAEIIDQLISIRSALNQKGEDITNVVLMGMGEPLLNYQNVLKAVRLMRLEMGPSIGARKITLSTAGIVPGIRRLSREGLKIGLAISLNATTDQVRDRLMPINRKYPISEVIQAGREFAERTSRWITVEYVLIRGRTDSREDAKRLGRLVRGVPSKINLIPFNPGPDTTFRRPPRDRIEEFRETLLAQGLTVTLRESRGDDIAAACGQLMTSVG